MPALAPFTYLKILPNLIHTCQSNIVYSHLGHSLTKLKLLNDKMTILDNEEFSETELNDLLLRIVYKRPRRALSFLCVLF